MGVGGQKQFLDPLLRQGSRAAGTQIIPARESSPSNRLPQWFDLLHWARPATMVAFGRLLLSLFALVSVYADPSQPTGDPTLTYGLGAAYCFFSAAIIVVTSRGVGTPRLGILTHIIDVTFCAGLIHLTDGVTSPFFVYFTFVLFSSAMGWGWQGAAATTIATVTFFLALSFTGDSDPLVHLDRIIIRVSYLAVAGGFFAYFAASAEASRLRLARLADWPNAEEVPGHPSIALVIAHAAHTLKLEKLIVAWPQRGATQMATYSGGKVDFVTIAEVRTFALPPVPAFVGKAEIEALPGMSDPFDLDLLDRGVYAPLPEHAAGWILLLGRRRPGADLLHLASIIAMRISVELKQQELRNQLVRTVAAEERAKLAQDIHDDVLQSLTAVGLRLKAIEAQLPAPHSGELATLRGLVSSQQQRLRALVSPPGGASNSAVHLVERLSALASLLEVQWGCTIEVEAEPYSPAVTEATIRNLELFIAEAVANAVRHGKANRFEIRQKLTADTIQISLRDNGRGLPGGKGLFDHETILDAGVGSASLRQRAAAQGWRMNLATSPDGTWIILEVSLSVSDADANIRIDALSTPPSSGDSGPQRTKEN